jgi:dTDP-4-dehydrorhamnose reductase
MARKALQLKMNILLFGANGQVGHELRSRLARLGPVVALTRLDVDFSRPDSLRAIVRRHRPILIVNAVAYTAVDKAEADAERAFAVNSTSPGVLAEEADALGATLVHYSTDYVFDGTKTSPYLETDAMVPLSVYGRTKRDGELAVGQCKKHLIFRTSWVIGSHGGNFVKTMLRLATERSSLRVVADQFGAPTSAALLAETTTQVLEQIEHSAAERRWGVYHLVADGETSWHGLACHSVARATSLGLSVRASPESIQPITTADYPTPAKRPANSRMATTKLHNSFAVNLPDWTDGVNAVLDELIPEMRQ